jgi:uncharacterized metal-binding protein YceD (DUF177 family)
VKSKEHKSFIIPFVGLSEGSHEFEFEANESFFDEFPEQDFSAPEFKVDLHLEKKTNGTMDLSFSAKGTATVECDRTSKPFQVDIEGSRFMAVRFAEAFNNDDDEILYLQEGSFELDLVQPIYELIVTSMPAKRLYPGLSEDDSVYVAQSTSETDKIDPRWSALNKLKSK